MHNKDPYILNDSWLPRFPLHVLSTFPPNFDQIGPRDDPANVDLVRTLCGPCAARRKNLWICFREKMPSTGSTSCPLFLLTILVFATSPAFRLPTPIPQPCIFSMEWEAWEAQNHWKCIDFHTFFMISSVEWEAWGAQTHCKSKDFFTFFFISAAGWEAWDAQNHWKYMISIQFS